MSGLTLPAFLLARIGEDEASAAAAGGGRWDEWSIESGDAEHIARNDPARVLAECEVKRRIVTYCGHIADDPTLPSTHLARHVLGDLALPYADHPDYREEWKP